MLVQVASKQVLVIRGLIARLTTVFPLGDELKQMRHDDELGFCFSFVCCVSLNPQLETDSCLLCGACQYVNMSIVGFQCRAGMFSCQHAICNMPSNLFLNVFLVASFLFIYFLTSGNRLRYSVIQSDVARDDDAYNASPYVTYSSDPSKVFASMFDDVVLR